MPRTFSASTHTGLTSRTTRRKAGQSHRSSALPFRLPAQLAGWHNYGTPPVSMSIPPGTSNCTSLPRALCVLCQSK